MAEQQWFAGLPVRSQRQLDDAEYERLEEIARSIRYESAGSYALTVLALILVVTASTMSMVTNCLGPIVLSASYGLMRYLPQRRFFSPQLLLRLRKDLTARTLLICESEDVTLQVLAHSHIVWARNDLPVEPFVVAHSTSTALLPEHAAMAANFVRPAEDDSSLHVHQRALSAEEIAELDSYAPRPSFAVWVLAFVGLAGAASTFGLALLGRITTLLPPFVFLVIGSWSLISAIRARRARRIVASDLEAGIVVILRSHENGDLGPPEEVLPFSQIVWSTSGGPAEWRKYVRKK